MKSKLSIFLSLITFILFACSKKNETKYLNVQRSAETINTDTLVYEVMETTTEESVSELAECPQHALYSKMMRAGGSGRLTYHYLSDPNYIGEDFVKIRMSSDGTQTPAEVSYVHLTITVRD